MIIKLNHKTTCSFYHGKSVSDVDVPPTMRSFDSIPQSAGNKFGAAFKILVSTI